MNCICTCIDIWACTLNLRCFNWKRKCDLPEYLIKNLISFSFSFVRTASGTLMHYSNHNNTLPEMHMILSSWKVSSVISQFHKVFMFGFFPLVVIWCYICSSFHHKGTSGRLCGAGKAGPWDWWLWFQRVWYSVL